MKQEITIIQVGDWQNVFGLKIQKIVATNDQGLVLQFYNTDTTIIYSPEQKGLVNLTIS